VIHLVRHQCLAVTWRLVGVIRGSRTVLYLPFIFRSNEATSLGDGCCVNAAIFKPQAPGGPRLKVYIEPILTSSRQPVVSRFIGRARHQLAAPLVSLTKH
jgi:hypothetical protein